MKIFAKIITAVLIAALSLFSFGVGRAIGGKMNDDDPKITYTKDETPEFGGFLRQADIPEKNSFYMLEDYWERKPSDIDSIIGSVSVTEGRTDCIIRIMCNDTEITLKKGVDADIARQLLADTERLDPALLSCVKTIELTPELLQKQYDLDIGEEVIVRGMSDGVNIRLADRYYRDYALIHECFHNVDYCFGDVNGRFSLTEDFDGLMNDYVIPRDYPLFESYYVSDKTSGEYFAAMGMFWYMAPDYLKAADPVIYDFFESRFGELFPGRYAGYELRFKGYNKLTGKWEN